MIHFLEKLLFCWDWVWSRLDLMQLRAYYRIKTYIEDKKYGK